MKKKLLISGLIFWIIIALLLVGLLIGAVTGALSFPAIFGSIGSYFSYSLVKQDTASADGLTDIKLNCASYDVKIMLTDTDEITVRQYDKDENNPYTLASKNGVLTLSLGSKIYIGVNFGIPRIEIEIPESYAGRIEVENTSGSIKCNDYVNLDALILSTNSGTIVFSGEIHSVKMSASSTSGSIKLADIYADTVTVSSNSGSLKLEDITAGTVDVSSSSGSQRLGNVSSKNISVQATSGTISAGEIFAQDSVKFQTSSGSMKIAAVTCDTTSIKTSSGTVSVEALCGSGEIGSSSGTIRIGDAVFTDDTGITAKSASIKVTLLEDNNITLQLSTNSGSIRVENPDATPSGKINGNGICTIGDGSTGTVKIQTSSGSIRIY